MDCKLSTPEIETLCVLVHISWVLGENLSPSVGALRVGSHTSGPSVDQCLLWGAVVSSIEKIVSSY